MNASTEDVNSNIDRYEKGEHTGREYAQNAKITFVDFGETNKSLIKIIIDLHMKDKDQKYKDGFTKGFMEELPQIKLN